LLELLARLAPDLPALSRIESTGERARLAELDRELAAFDGSP